MDGVDRIYIMHYSKLTERKKKLQERLLSAGFDTNKITWVEQFDREVATQKLINDFYYYNPTLLGRQLTLPEIMNGIAHLYIIEQACSHSVTLILEDDIIFKENFINNVKKCLEVAPSDWEILTLGGNYDDGTGDYPLEDIHPIKEGDLQVITPRQITSTVSCYILKNTAARKILACKLSKPFFGPIDYMFTYFMPKIDIKIYWAKPFLAYEASKCGECGTTLERGF